jgi:hypothetical protein
VIDMPSQEEYRSYLDFMAPRHSLGKNERLKLLDEITTNTHILFWFITGEHEKRRLSDYEQLFIVKKVMESNNIELIITLDKYYDLEQLHVDQSIIDRIDSIKMMGKIM